MVKFSWDKLKRFLAQANTWTGQQTFSNINVTGGSIGGATITENLTTSTDPAANAAVTTAIVNSYNGVVVTLTAAGNTQTIQNPTTAATIRKFMVVNNDTSNNNLSVVANSVTFVLTPGEGQCFIWDGTAWGPTDLGITSLPVPVTQGGTGVATLTDHGVLLGSGTGAITPLAEAATGTVLAGTTGSDPSFTSTPSVTDATLSGNVLGTPTYSSIGDMMDVTISSGYVSGGDITDNASGGINISQVEGFIKTTDSAVGVSKFFTLAAGSILSAALTDNSVNYIYVDYNSGTPQFAATADRTTIKTTNQFPIGRIYKVGTDIAILKSGIQLQNYIRRNHERLVSRGNMERMSGSVISATGTRQVAVTAGVWYVGANKLSFGAIDSSATNFNHYYYYTGAAWAETAATGTIDNTNYNNVASGLAELTANRYGVHWVYQCFEGDISVVYGQGDYTLSQAEASKVPSSIPDYLAKFGVLIGRIIIKKSASSFASVESVYDTTFIPETVTTHNNLAGLQGGTTAEYYHLTSAQHTNLLAGTNGQVLVGSTGADPVFATITDGEGIDTTLGAGTLTIACEDASTTNKGVVELATVAEAVAGTSTTLTPTCNGVAAAVAVVEREPNQGVAMTAVTSGSTGIAVADNDNIDFGTGDFTLVWKGSLPDWTPSTNSALVTKRDTSTGTSGYILVVRSDTTPVGKLRIYLDTTAGGGSLTEYDSSVATGLTDGTLADIVAVIIRETVSSSGSIIFYLNGVQLGTAVSITQGTPISISSAYNLYVGGSSSTRNAGTTHHAYTFNRALTAAEVLDLYRNGIAVKHRKASQTALTSGTLVTGQEYTIDTFAAGDDFANVGGTNETGNVFVATGTTPTTWTNSSSLRATGGTLILEPEGIQPAPGQWLDSSSNNLHALQPATGSSLTRSKRDFTIKWTNTWAGTHELQYIGGVNQAILPPNCYIDSIIGVITGGTIEDIIIGDGSDTDRWVTITTGLAAGTVAFTIANAISDGTNYKMTVDPDANFTGSIAWTINGKIL